jgi:uncharacterized protein YcbX
MKRPRIRYWAIILSNPAKDIAAGEAHMENIHVTALYVYPVKSMKGISMASATLTSRGLLHDRTWMVVGPDGRFVTQRQRPRLALVHTQLDDLGVVLSMEGHGSISIPFEAGEGAAVATHVWGDACETIDQGRQVSEWLTGAVGSDEPLRIVRMAPDFRRPQNRPERFGADTTTHFADSAPFLVANEDSLGELNRNLQAQGHAPVPMNRFRPNIVVRGLEPFAEHQVPALAGNGWRLTMADHCVRCAVTTIDQQTAVRDPAREPYLTLRRINPAPGDKPAPAFGQNAVLDRGAGVETAVGSEVTVAQIG